MVAHLEGNWGAAGLGWREDFVVHTTLYVLNFELCEYITYIKINDTFKYIKQKQ